MGELAVAALPAHTMQEVPATQASFSTQTDSCSEAKTSIQHLHTQPSELKVGISGLY